MKILLVYPKFPETFWSFKYALKFISKKSTDPPLGLLTVASMFPKNWEKKLVDMNISSLKDKDIEWADYVFISAMAIQKKSVKEITGRCKKLHTRIVAGGPLFTSYPDDFSEIDHLVLNEAELTFPLFLQDLKIGCAKSVYTSSEWADIKHTPVPSWELINMKNYASMDIQYSRGCPFNCKFCDITLLYGHKTRTKTSEQIITELEAVYQQGWRGDVFFVDDNFIGNKGELKNKVLPAIANWMKKRSYPFAFLTQASINISDDEVLMGLMALAGFDKVFVGIESPHEESLDECSKVQNKGRDLEDCIKKIHKFGFQVRGGFIVGFDSDPSSIFEKQIEFIKNTGIVTAMVGLLNAPRGTKLYNSLKKENRLLQNPSGDNTDCSMNFIPKMKYETLLGGYKKILKSIYSPCNYYKRVTVFLKTYKPAQKRMFQYRFPEISAFIKSIFFLGIIGKERVYYWRLFWGTLFRRPKLLPLAITYAIYGFHFRKIFEKIW